MHTADGIITPSVERSTMVYYLYVPNSQLGMSISANAYSSFAMVTVDPDYIIPKVGNNLILITIVAQNTSYVSNYYLTINRAPCKFVC